MTGNRCTAAPPQSSLSNAHYPPRPFKQAPSLILHLVKVEDPLALCFGLGKDYVERRDLGGLKALAGANELHKLGIGHSLKRCKGWSCDMSMMSLGMRGAVQHPMDSVIMQVHRTRQDRVLPTSHEHIPGAQYLWKRRRRDRKAA